MRSELRALRNLVDLLPHTPQKKFPARLKRALSVSTALRAMGHDGESLRELLGEQDLASKTFLKNLTRFHRLKRRLDHIAATILSASFRENPEICSRKPPQPPLQPSESLDALLACGAAAFPELKAMIGDAVRAADLKPLDQPNMFIEIAQGGDELYTAGTPGPLKTRERCAEKAKNEYDDDFRRLVDVARASIVVDTEDQLEAVFRHLLADPARVVRLKNRFANPSFNGYRDALFTVRLDLPGGGSHLAEIQVHLSPILALKAEAHVYYNFFRTHFHGNMKSCDVCMKLLDGVVGQEEFSVAMLEKVAKSRDVTKLAMLGRLFEVHCQQYAIAKLFLMRCAQVKGERGGAGYAYALRNVGKICMRNGDYDAVEWWLRKSIEVSRNSLAQPAATLGPDIAAGLSNLGDMLTQKGDHAGAERALLESIEQYDMSIRAADECHERIASTWSYQKELAPADGAVDHRQTGRAFAKLRLANVRKEEGKYAEALQHANEAVDVIEQGHKDSNTAYALTIRGTLRLRVGDNAEGAKDFGRALQIRLKTSGSDNPLTAIALRKRGKARRYLGGNSGASKNDFVAAIRVFIKAYGEDNRETIKTMTELAELLLCLPGELDAAEDYSRRAHASATKVFEYTDDHVVLQEARATLGRVHSARGRHDEAIALLGRFENAAGDREYYCASLLLAKARAAPRAEGFRGLVEEALRIRKGKFRPEDELAEARVLLQLVLYCRECVCDYLFPPLTKPARLQTGPGFELQVLTVGSQGSEQANS